jgi:hypothetical protein
LCVAEAEVEASQQALKVHKEMLLEAQDQCRLQAMYDALPGIQPSVFHCMNVHFVMMVF